MRAVVARGRRLSVEDVDEPVAGLGEVLARVIACGICGSDLHALQYAPEGESPGLGPLAAAQGRPVVMGHEFAAEIVDYGPQTRRALGLGTVVTSIPVVVRGEQRVSLPYGEELPGGYAEYVVLTEAMLLPVPAHVDPQHAALTEPMAVGLHAVAKSSLQPGEVPVVVGCGPVGLAVVAALRMRGCDRIVAADFSPKRRVLAQAMGATVAVDPREMPALEAWRAEVPGEAPALVFECVGVPGVIDRVMEDVPRGSRIVVVGVCMEADTIRPLLGIGKEIALQFVLGYTPQEFAETLAAISDGRLDVAPLITARVGLEDVPAAFAMLARPEEHAKVLVVP